MMNRRNILIVIGALLALCVCVVAVSALFIVTRAIEEPGQVEITVSAPASVPPNEPFLVTVSVQNLAPSIQMLHSIDIQTNYLDGFSVESAKPAYLDTFPLPVVGYHSFTFERDIPANSTLETEFVLVGEAEGTFSGEFDVCINDGSTCLGVPVETAVGAGNGR